MNPGSTREMGRVMEEFTYDETLDALCSQTDPAIFFATSGDWQDTRAAKKVCQTCPLGLVEHGGSGRCLEVALANNEHGVWSATTEHQRKKILRARREELAA